MKTIKEMQFNEIGYIDFNDSKIMWDKDFAFVIDNCEVHSKRKNEFDIAILKVAYGYKAIIPNTHDVKFWKISK